MQKCLSFIADTCTLAISVETNFFLITILSSKMRVKICDILYMHTYSIEWHICLVLSSKIYNILKNSIFFLESVILYHILDILISKFYSNI